MLALGVRVIQRDLKEAEEMKKSKDCPSFYPSLDIMVQCCQNQPGVQGKAEAASAVVFCKFPEAILGCTRQCQGPWHA